MKKFKPTPEERPLLTTDTTDLTLPTKDELEHDFTATPKGVILQARKMDNLVLVATATPRLDENVLIEYPFGDIWRGIVGYSRFVRWRRRVKGRHYGLIRDGRNR